MGCGTCDSFGICTNQCQNDPSRHPLQPTLSPQDQPISIQSQQKTVDESTQFRMVTVLFHGKPMFSVVDQDDDLVGITHRERFLIQARPKTCAYLEEDGLPYGEHYKAFKAIQLDNGHYALDVKSLVMSDSINDNKSSVTVTTLSTMKM